MEIDPHLFEIRANLDDQSPEQLAPMLDLLLAQGAADAWLTPIIMKKGRPALQLSLLVKKELLNQFEELIFKHTTTLGFRYSPVTAHRLERRFEEVDTPWGRVKIKLGFYNGKMTTFAPEFEDCAQLARETGIPLKEVFAAANLAFG